MLGVVLWIMATSMGVAGFISLRRVLRRTAQRLCGLLEAANEALQHVEGDETSGERLQWRLYTGRNRCHTRYDYPLKYELVLLRCQFE